MAAAAALKDWPHDFQKTHSPAKVIYDQKAYKISDKSCLHLLSISST
jgi:hypothetical protein